MIHFDTLPIEGGATLTPSQIAQWQENYPEEYEDYIEAGLFDPETGYLQEFPDWMIDGIDGNGPFDFSLNPSQAHWGW